MKEKQKAQNEWQRNDPKKQYIEQQKSGMNERMNYETNNWIIEQKTEQIIKQTAEL